MKPLASNPIARASDPATSHLAAEHITQSGMRSRQQHAVLALLKLYPGRTSQELARYGIDRYALARRLPELESAGLARKGDARRCDISGRQALTWWPA